MEVQVFDKIKIFCIALTVGTNKKCVQNGTDKIDMTQCGLKVKIFFKSFT